MKKVGENARPFTYDLDQTPYNSTVEVTIDARDIRPDRQRA